MALSWLLKADSSVKKSIALKKRQAPRNKVKGLGKDLMI
jgi:hypothetical protein